MFKQEPFRKLATTSQYWRILKKLKVVSENITHFDSKIFIHTILSNSPFSPTKGSDQVKTSMKLGSQ